MLKKALVAIAAVVVLAAAAPASAASIVGSQIQGSYHFPNDGGGYFGSSSFSVNPFIVGAGVESLLTVDGGAGLVNVDFSANSLVLTFLGSVSWTPAAFNGPQFSVLAGNGFGSVFSVVASGGQSVGAVVDGGILKVNWQGQVFTTEQYITIEFDGAEVPEPGTLLLFGTGLVGLVAARRRLRARA